MRRRRGAPAAGYCPGDSLVHRASPGVKLTALLVMTVAMFTVPALVGGTALPVAVGAAVLAAGLVALTRLPPRASLAQVLPVLPAIALLFGVRWWTDGPVSALAVCLRLAATVTLAGLVTVSTRPTDMVDSVERGLRPLRHLGVDPARFGLLVALTLRSVNVLGDLAGRVRDAQRARGATASPRAFVLPFVIATVRHAEALGEALAARGLDDEREPDATAAASR